MAAQENGAEQLLKLGKDEILNLIESFSEGFPFYSDIAGRPKAALLFWFFSGFRCGVPLFIVLLVLYKYKNR